MKTVLIFDLDNTIYPVSSIADNLFAGLFRLLDEHAGTINANDQDIIAKIKDEMTRRPFQYIADKYGLNDEIRNAMENELRTMSYDLPMQPFDDYHSLRQIPFDKFLVTTGYQKLQYSKIKQLNIKGDFLEIFIVDPDKSKQTKKDVFGMIMEKYGYRPEDLLVIGDDPASEIKAALELGIDTFLFDPKSIYPDTISTHRSQDLKGVLDVLK
ncbi:MAG: HAD family hydrolase [Bacteroidetes bacterium]|nr:HAD family hydrolase [Bacteroidota bacterium]